MKPLLKYLRALKSDVQSAKKQLKRIKPDEDPKPYHTRIAALEREISKIEEQLKPKA